MALGLFESRAAMSSDGPSVDDLRGPPGGPLEDRVLGIDGLVDLIFKMAFQGLELPLPSPK